MSSLELKVPPPLVALCAALLMWLAAKATPSLELSVWLRVGVGAAFVVVGMGMGLAGLLAFRQAKTTINPTKPTAASSLVTRGVYTFSRNPMYLGLLFVLLGFVSILASPMALVLLPAFVAYINRFQITPEERVLALLFGQAFTAYKTKVRRWL